jgi:hypothetical protein
MLPEDYKKKSVLVTRICELDIRFYGNYFSLMDDDNTILGWISISHVEERYQPVLYLTGYENLTKRDGIISTIMIGLLSRGYYLMIHREDPGMSNLLDKFIEYNDRHRPDFDFTLLTKIPNAKDTMNDFSDIPSIDDSSLDVLILNRRTDFSRVIQDGFRQEIHRINLARSHAMEKAGLPSCYWGRWPYKVPYIYLDNEELL